MTLRAVSVVLAGQRRQRPHVDGGRRRRLVLVLVASVHRTSASSAASPGSEVLPDCPSRSRFAEIQDLDGLTSFIETNFDWIESHEDRAMVYFVRSIGTTLDSENVRRETRYALTRAASGAVQRLGSETSTVDGTVRALGLVTLLDVGAADILRPVSSYTDLGKVKFREAIAQKLLT